VSQVSDLGCRQPDAGFTRDTELTRANGATVIRGVEAT
jgi:hypothetical protein